ncbi:MAG: nucleotidyltransferase domain-containing protein [Chloroflexi bacterium]|nr:nucleotidyltransferase domain-containing protein [Chloroflexota bacterium]
MQARAEIPTLDTIRDALTPALEASGAQRAIVFGSYARGDADEYSALT